MSARIFFIFVFLFFAVLQPLATRSHAQEGISESVVKIYVVTNRYNYHEPWQKIGQTSSQGSGVIIDGNRILTNAHVVSDATFIQVRRGGKVKKVTAKIIALAHECDLALLSVEDPAFFEDTRPLTVGKLPQLRDKVVLYGFPEGGDKLSITEGVVARVEHSNYSHSNAYLLTCQIDAPVNPGTSGGPAIMNGKIAGIAFQFLSGRNVERTGYMVPAPVVQRFLDDIGDGQYEGIPGLGMSMQKMENPDMRRMFGLKDDDIGVLVNRVYPGSPAHGRIFPGDVVLKIDGQAIGHDGTIEFRPDQRTYFGYTVQQKFIGQKVRLTVLRDKKKQDFELTLSKPQDFERLVRHQQYDLAPTYYIMGGMVFEPLTRNYLAEYGGESQWANNAPTELMNLYLNGEQTEKKKEVVILVKVLADNVNVGYHNFEDTVIDKVNGQVIGCMADLVRAFEDGRGPYHVVEDVRGYQIILDRKRAEGEGQNILKRYAISAGQSVDLQHLRP